MTTSRRTAGRVLRRWYALCRLRWRFRVQLLRRIQGLRDKRLMDIGDVLTDEFDIVESRRAILQNSVAGTKNPNPLGRTDGQTRDKLAAYYQKVHGLRVP